MQRCGMLYLDVYDLWRVPRNERDAAILLAESQEGSDIARTPESSDFICDGLLAK